VALLLGLVGWLAVAGLQGSGLALASSPAPAGRSSPGWTRALRLGRVAHRPLHAGAARAASIDGWLMFQPQLPLLLIGGVLAIVLVH